MELKVLGIQLVGIIIALLMVFETRVLYKKGQFKRKDLIIWSTVSIVIFFIALFPNTVANIINIFTNISRGLDALIIFGLLGSYAMIFHVYIRNQESQRQITELIRKVAMKFEEVEEKKPKKKKK